MTKEEKATLFNRIHSNYTAAIYDYSKNNDFKRMREATLIFQDFIAMYERILELSIEEVEYLKSLSFRNIENDKKLLMQKKKTSK